MTLTRNPAVDKTIFTPGIPRLRVWLLHWREGSKWWKAYAWGTAAGGATAMTPGTELGSPEEADALSLQGRVEELAQRLTANR